MVDPAPPRHSRGRSAPTRRRRAFAARSHAPARRRQRGHHHDHTARAGPGARSDHDHHCRAPAPVARSTRAGQGGGGDCRPSTLPGAGRRVGGPSRPGHPGASGPIDADGRYDFTFSTTPPGCPAGPRPTGSAAGSSPGPERRHHRHGRLSHRSHLDLRDPQSRDRRTGRADEHDHASTTTSTHPLLPDEQTWYFDGRIDEVGTGCDEIGVVVQTGDDQRIRVRDGGPTATRHLPRPTSRTLR